MRTLRSLLPKLLLGFVLFCPLRALAAEACPEFFTDRTPPKTSKPYTLLCNEGFAVGFSKELKEPLWSAEHLTRETVLQARQLHGRAPFHDDPHLKGKEQAHRDDYRMTIWTKGHMTPSGDMPTRSSRFQSFAFSNMIPQNHVLNTGPWEHIEQRVRTEAIRYGEVFVLTGPILSEDLGEIGKDHIKVPSSVWKAVYIPLEHRGYIVVCHNENESKCTHVSSTELEKEAGITLNIH